MIPILPLIWLTGFDDEEAYEIAPHDSPENEERKGKRSVNL